VDTQHWNPRLWAILIVLCGALFLDGLDVSMVGVALPDIRTALGLSTSSLQWVVSGYVLGYGGLLLLGGACSWPRWPCSRSRRCSAGSSAAPSC
jgi:MFS family permease